jgi:hypothetical protein
VGHLKGMRERKSEFWRSWGYAPPRVVVFFEKMVFSRAERGSVRCLEGAPPQVVWCEGDGIIHKNGHKTLRGSLD